MKASQAPAEFVLAAPWQPPLLQCRQPAVIVPPGSSVDGADAEVRQRLAAIRVATV